jgi:hypothetical protein
MAIEVVCPSCDASHKVKDESAGKKLKCKGCQKILAIPAMAVADEGDPWENLDENEGGEELPPVVRPAAASKKKSGKRTRAGSGDDSDVPIERTEAARRFGIGMMIFGAICTVAPLFGLQLRRLGDRGFLTPVIGVILLLIGVVSFIAGQNRILANVMTMGTKTIFWGIIALGVLILIAGTALVIGLHVYLR